MVAQVKMLTVNEFLAVYDLPENEDKRLELIDGVIYEMAPSSKKNSVIAHHIGSLLHNFVVGKRMGVVTTTDGGYQITPTNAFQPDAAYISRARAGGVEGTVFPVAPDIAVEVISPSETVKSVYDKTMGYLLHGSTLVWNVYIEDHTIAVCRLDTTGTLQEQVLTEADTLTGGDVLAGFSLSVREIFAVLEDLE